MFGGPWQHHGKRRILRPATLRVLYESPKNGAEIMDAIETFTHGRWRPSPGSVYPLLEDLTKERVVTKRDDGRYELTPDAMREFSWPGFAPRTGAQSADETIREIEGFTSYFEEIAHTDPAQWAQIKPRVAAIAARWKTLTEK